MIRGAVYRVDLGKPRGHERGGRRLGLVVSPTDSPLSVVTIIPTSTSAGASVHRPELEIDGRPTRLLVDQLRSIDLDHVHGDPVDFLNRDELAEVEIALAQYLGVHDVRPRTFENGRRGPQRAAADAVVRASRRSSARTMSSATSGTARS